MSRDPDFVVALDRPLPDSLPVGVGTALFCLGRCFHGRQPIRDLHVLADGVRHRAAAFGMPRPDASSRSEPGYYSGFWATVPVPHQPEPGIVALEAELTLADGSRVAAQLASIEVVEQRPPPVCEAQPERPGPPVIAVCMATFEPDTALLRTQVESLRSQTDDAWICIVSDDASHPERLAQIAEIVGPDPRFVVSRSETRQGFYRNFERALGLVPRDAGFVALCDQDDRWYPDKLESLRQAIGDSALVYSDQRLVDADGHLLRDTLWKGRANNHTNLASMLIANTITGAASLFRRDLLDVVLPFPDFPGFQFHDHWLGVAALAAGDVAYVDRPLYDYVQHGGAVFGDVTSGASVRATRRRRLPKRASAADLAERWRAAYFYGYLAREVQAETLLVRFDGLLTAPKRRTLERFVCSASSPAGFAWLVLRAGRSLTGRTETLGSEIQLARGILWRTAVAVAARRRKARPARFFDSGFPPPGSFSQRRLRRWRANV